jgi:hypothetical protein
MGVPQEYHSQLVLHGEHDTCEGHGAYEAKSWLRCKVLTPHGLLLLISDKFQQQGPLRDSISEVELAEESQKLGMEVCFLLHSEAQEGREGKRCLL